MSDLLFQIPQTSVPIFNQPNRFPVHRIYCVGRNYADHAREMGADPTREAPFFFTKPHDALVTDGQAVNYPAQTADLQHEIELVVALQQGGKDLTPQQAKAAIYGYAVGIDLTRRDLQTDAKAQGRPWCAAKAFDQSAPMGALLPATAWAQAQQGEISLTVNGQTRQHGQLQQMIWGIDEVIAKLSSLFTLAAGDLIFTGTPAGVAKLEPGDQLVGKISGLPSLETRIV